MILDKTLCFLNKEGLSSVTTGVIGNVVDLGAPRQLRGRQCYVVVISHEDTTATGSPTISFGLEFSDTAAFSASQIVPLSLPVLGKTDLAAGNFVGTRAPTISGRYARLRITTSAALVCASVTAGFVLDEPEGLFGD